MSAKLMINCVITDGIILKSNMFVLLSNKVVIQPIILSTVKPLISNMLSALGSYLIRHHISFACKYKELIPCLPINLPLPLIPMFIDFAFEDVI